jgi:hypothetical protein
MELEIKNIEQMIYIIRGQRVMLDSDLAKLYGVETGALNRQVRRNKIRFPGDFMFQLTKEEFGALICQNGISKTGRGGRQKQPLVFTENGVAMLSSVLKSERAALVNIAIMRIFTKLRSFLMLEKELSDRMGRLESGTNAMFKVVFERLDDIESSEPGLAKDRKKIGLKGQ